MTKNMTIKENFAFAVEKHKKNNFKIAEKFYKKILKKDPNHFDSIFLLGTLSFQTAKFGLAKQLFQKATQIQPNNMEAHYNLGNTLKELGEFQKAKNCYARAIQINANYLNAYNNLGTVFEELKDYQKAINCYQKSLELQPNHIQTFYNLGNSLIKMGDYQKAISYYKKAVHIQPNYSEAYCNLGNAQKELGDFREAINCYQKALEYEPENLDYYYSLSLLKKEILDLNLKNKIDKIINVNNSSKKNLAYGNFLLSRYELKEKNYEKEFNYLLKGHYYYFESKKEKFERGISLFKELLENIELILLNKSNNKIEKNNFKIKPIFIIGTPRCGSTLIEKIISSGTNYIPIGEETNIFHSYIIGEVLQQKSPNYNIETIHDDIIKKYKQKKLIQEKNDFIFTDKSLENFFYIKLIKEIFPFAKVINCKRNSFFSVMSILKNNLVNIPWAHNLDHILEYFNIYYEISENIKKIFPNFVYELKFEKFINDPEMESKNLFKFCDLPWNIKCLEFYKRKDLISRTASNIQIRKAIYKDSVQKYLPYKQFFNKYGKKYSWFNQHIENLSIHDLT